jgi:cell wall-associated NlpC family hydrolase
MQLKATLFATLFLTSAVFANAIPEVADELDISDASLNATESTALEDGVPAFDPLELSGPPAIADEQKRDLDDEDFEESVIEKRSAASNIVAAAAKLKGTRYLYGGCKANKPFGPAKGGLDCSCLSRTAVYKGTKTTIRKSPTFLSLIPSLHNHKNALTIHSSNRRHSV